ncbi:MAG: two-component system response regulator HydG [Candidatus Krumholzibacteriia bacterium]|jgi:two-component system response regulator HydG
MENGIAKPRPRNRLSEYLKEVHTETIGQVFAALNEGVIAVGTDLRVVTMNPTAEALFGCRHEDLSGDPVCNLLGEEGCEENLLSRTLMAGESIVDFQTTINMGGDKRGDVLLRSVPMLHQDGSPFGVAIILGDVTEITDLRKRVERQFKLGRLVGRDNKMQDLFSLISDVGPSEATVLIQGESGTGKELVARAVHDASGRSAGPFVQVNCSALSENLLESELFGHVRGAYTGAVGDRRGRFEEAHGGTIFLDEIGDVSPVVQVKLLRVLQERTVERVGDSKSIPVDVRIVSATNRDLKALIASGQVREDFYYRIKVVSLVIPPLRDRTEDIPLLVSHFVTAISRREGRSDIPAVAGETMATLMNYPWPGNVRELENAIEHAIVLSRGGVIRAEHLPRDVATTNSPAQIGLQGVPLHSQNEQLRLSEALKKTGWNRTRAARQLGIDRTTLWRKIKEYGLSPEES